MGEIVKAETGAVIHSQVKCADCLLDCVLKRKAVECQRDVLCIVPEARAHAYVFNHPVISNDILVGLASVALKGMHNRVARSQKPQDIKAYYEMLIDYKQAFYPELQKTANLNINVNAAQDIIEKILEQQLK